MPNADQFRIDVALGLREHGLKRSPVAVLAAAFDSDRLAENHVGQRLLRFGSVRLPPFGRVDS